MADILAKAITDRRYAIEGSESLSSDDQSEIDDDEWDQ